MKESVAICTYSQCPRLFRSCKEFTKVLPFRHIPLYKWRPIYTADLLSIDADWVIHIDEDAFLFNPNSLLKIINFMSKHGFSCAGVPDGGVIPHRTHNPLACNPFFMILNRKEILRHGETHADIIAQTEFNPELIKYTPTWIKNKHTHYEYCTCEPFYGIFFWLLLHGQKILYLKSYQTNFPEDDISTILLDCNETPFIAHSWYSREYYIEGNTICHRLIRKIFKQSNMELLKQKGKHYERITNVLRWSHDNASKLHYCEDLVAKYKSW